MRAQVGGFEGHEIVDIQCGFNHSVVLTSDGSVWVFGAAAATGGVHIDRQVLC